MKRWRAMLMILAAVVLLGSPALWSWSNSSGVHSVIALFESHVHPDLPFDQFAAGRLGIIQPGWRLSFLYVAYRDMAGPGFDAGEQKALVTYWNDAFGVDLPTADSQWVNAGSGVDNSTAIALGQASAGWIAARNKVPDVGTIDTIDVDRNASGSFVNFANCNANAFLTATQTLGTMIGKFSLSSPQVKQWVDTQDQVFDNCSNPQFDPNVWSNAVDEWDQARKQVPGLANPPWFGSNCPGEKFQTAASELNGMVLKMGASNLQVRQWVEARDQALGECSRQPQPTPTPGPEIPQPLDNGTPFEQAQRNYQIASAYFYSGNYDSAAKLFNAIAADPSSPWRQLAPYLVARSMIRKATLSSAKNDHALLALAEAQLNHVVATSSDDSVKHSAQRLLGFVEAQLHPQEREEELARAVMLPGPGDVLEQDVSDYIWMLENRPPDDAVYNNDLTDWILTLSGPAAGNIDAASALAHSIIKWKQTSSVQWLVAAIMQIPASDPNASSLINSGEAVQPGSPAFTTVTYHSARLLIGLGKSDEARAKLGLLLARRDELPISTINQVAALRMSIARNLNELLVYAPRTPLGLTDDADSDELPSELDDANLKAIVAGPLFDEDGAGALTRWLPLSVLIQAVHSQSLPSRLRSQVALSTFIRAIMLGDESAARELAPFVMKSYPQLQPSIEVWLNATSEDAQRFDAAFMMLQNPGLRFEIDPGPGRITPLDQIDSLRDNWWSRVGLDYKDQTYPSFLTDGQKKSADEEWQKLSAINAPNFLCSEAIAQAKRDPKDERAPEALYRCLRAVHLGCSNSEGTELAKSAYQLLHRRYPQSNWAAEGQFWYRGDDCH